MFFFFSQNWVKMQKKETEEHFFISWWPLPSSVWRLQIQKICNARNWHVSFVSKCQQIREFFGQFVPHFQTRIGNLPCPKSSLGPTSNPSLCQLYSPYINKAKYRADFLAWICRMEIAFNLIKSVLMGGRRAGWGAGGGNLINLGNSSLSKFPRTGSCIIIRFIHHINLSADLNISIGNFRTCNECLGIHSVLSLWIQ